MGESRRRTTAWRSAAPFLLPVLLIGAGDAGAQSAPSHVVAKQSRLAGALRDGVTRSPTLAALVATLDASDVVVHLHDGACDGSTESCLMLASAGSSPRVVRVHFRLASARRHGVLERYDGLIAQIAHELQHAVEIASDASVVDARTLSARFQRIGRGRPTARGTAYETEAALRVGRKVGEELRGVRKDAGGRRGGAVAGAAAPW